MWNYDSLGNIESLLVYDYTTGAVSNPESGIDYQYTNDNKEGWNKLLTTLVYKEYIYNETHPNGTPDVISTETVNYDKIGNPTNYQGATMSWFGRQMTSYSKGNVSATFTYDADGLRGSKTVNGAKTTYYYVGDKLYYQHTANADGSTNYELYFYYDSYNNLSAIRYISKDDKIDCYFYVTTNMQGDVLGIYTSEGALRASYEYDAWGNATVYAVSQNAETGKDEYTKITNQATSGNIGAINPIRYRGYYYDTDLELYYLQSRYYDSTIGRFINVDAFITTGQGILGLNMFAYCLNNPIIYSDPTGEYALCIHLRSSSNCKYCKQDRERIAAMADVGSDSNYRPYKGKPGSTYTAPNGDTRTYGADGTPIHDYDHDDHGNPKNHPHDQNGGHNHDWKDGSRGPAYSVRWEHVAGGIIVTTCVIATVYIVGNDLTGIGAIDDFLLAPFGAGMSKGIEMLTGC